VQQDGLKSDRRRPGMSLDRVISSVIFACVDFHLIFIAAVDTHT
jgi:hypothetical protein